MAHRLALISHNFSTPAFLRLNWQPPLPSRRFLISVCLLPHSSRMQNSCLLHYTVIRRREIFHKSCLWPFSKFHDGNDDTAVAHFCRIYFQKLHTQYKLTSQQHCRTQTVSSFNCKEPSKWIIYQHICVCVYTYTYIRRGCSKELTFIWK